MQSLIGKRFQLLTVIEEPFSYISPNTGKAMKKCKCRCDCGAEVITRLSSLKSGHTKGCGQKHRKVEDLTGQIFGNLTVLERADDYINKDGTKYIRWLCNCSCGKQSIVRASALKYGSTKSCGCLHSISAMGNGLNDITGQVFGRWTVLYENGRVKEPRGRIVPLWRCRCECGEERDLRAGTLKGGLSLSCGCYKYERLKELSSNGFSVSKAEKIVNNYLYDNHYYYECQKIYSTLRSESGYPLSYDFLVYKNGKPYLLIECQGKQHYEPVEYFGGAVQFQVQIKNDAIKKDYANSLHILLLEIPYTCSTNESIIQLLSTYL